MAEDVDDRRLLGDPDRIVQRQDQHAGRQPDRRRHGGDRGEQRHHGGQVAVRGDVVLGEVHPLVALRPRPRPLGQRGVVDSRMPDRRARRVLAAEEHAVPHGALSAAGALLEVGADSRGALLGARVGDLDELERVSFVIGEVDPAPPGEHALVDLVYVAEEPHPLRLELGLLGATSSTRNATCWAPTAFCGSGAAIGDGGGGTRVARGSCRRARATPAAARRLERRPPGRAPGRRRTGSAR